MAMGDKIYAARCDFTLPLGYESVERRSGPSEASALSSAAVAIIQEYLRNGFYNTGVKNISNGFTPNASLLKAMFIHSAENLRGHLNRQYKFVDFTEWPNGIQGHGIASLDRVLYFADEPHFRLRIIENCIDKDSEGDIYKMYFYPSQMYKATLVWTDPPVDPRSSKMLLNDLDLEVIIGNRLYYPNMKLGGDRLNNVEVISFPTSMFDSKEKQYLRVRVMNHEIATQKQCYSLVLTGEFYDNKNDDRKEYDPLPDPDILPEPPSTEYSDPTTLLPTTTPKPTPKPTPIPTTTTTTPIPTTTTTTPIPIPKPTPIPTTTTTPIPKPTPKPTPIPTTTTPIPNPKPTPKPTPIPTHIPTTPEPTDDEPVDDDETDEIDDEDDWNITTPTYNQTSNSYFETPTSTYTILSGGIAFIVIAGIYAILYYRHRLAREAVDVLKPKVGNCPVIRPIETI